MKLENYIEMVHKMELDGAVRAIEEFLEEDSKRGTITRDTREYLLRMWDIVKVCHGIEVEA